MVIVALVFGVLWHIWNIFGGEIPSISELVMKTGGENDQDRVVWSLPFSISHSWDVLVAPLFVLAFWRLIVLFEWKPDYLITGLVLGLISGVGSGLSLNVIGLIAIGMGIGLI